MGVTRASFNDLLYENLHIINPPVGAGHGCIKNDR
jgi:hypothetical protein